jgi:phage-related protein (TIGR01555 family)
MSLRQRLSTALARRLDAGPPALPAPPAPPAEPSSWQRRVDSIVNMMTGLGGLSDKGAAGRPNLYWSPLTDAELVALYRTNGYARRFVDIIPNDATKKGWKVVDDTQQPDVLKEEGERLEITARVAQAWKMARLRGGAVILMVTDDEIPPEFRRQPHRWLSQPLDLTRVRKLLNLVVLTRAEAHVTEYDSDIRSPGFRQPKLWSIYPSTGSGFGLAGDGLNLVHASRVLYIPGAELPPDTRYENAGFDDSVLQAVWDQVRNKTSIDQGGAVLVQGLRQAVVKILGLENKAVGDQAALFNARMRLMAQSLGMLNMAVLGAGEEYETNDGSVAGFGDLDDAAKEALAAVTGIPLTRWFGLAPGGLNADGESQRGMWNDVVSASQEYFLRPPLTRLYRVVYAAKEGPTRGAIPKSFKVEFCPLEEPTRKEIADYRHKVALTDQILIDSGVVSPEHVARSRFGEDGWQDELLPMSEEDLAELELEPEEEPEVEDEDEPQPGENAPIPAK